MTALSVPRKGGNYSACLGVCIINDTAITVSGVTYFTNANEGTELSKQVMFMCASPSDVCIYA